MCTRLIAHLTKEAPKVRRVRVEREKSWKFWQKTREGKSQTEKNKLSPSCFFDDSRLKTDHEICFFTGSDRPSTMNWSPDGDLALCVVIFSSAHLPAQILDNLLAAGIPNPPIHPHSLRPCVSQHRTRVYFGSRLRNRFSCLSVSKCLLFCPEIITFPATLSNSRSGV